MAWEEEVIPIKLKRSFPHTDTPCTLFQTFSSRLFSCYVKTAIYRTEGQDIADLKHWIYEAISPINEEMLGWKWLEISRRIMVLFWIRSSATDTYRTYLFIFILYDILLSLFLTKFISWVFIRKIDIIE